MQFDNQKTRNVADVVAKILAGESAQTQPEMLEEELKGNQHKIDANKNNKVDAHDFKLLRAQKEKEKANSMKHGKEVKEEVGELGEGILSNFLDKRKLNKTLSSSSSKNNSYDKQGHHFIHDVSREHSDKESQIKHLHMVHDHLTSKGYEKESSYNSRQHDNHMQNKHQDGSPMSGNSISGSHTVVYKKGSNEYHVHYGHKPGLGKDYHHFVHVTSPKSVNEETEEIDEATPTAQQVKQGIGIARDKRYAKGNVTGAVKAMDKVNKGIAQHPVVNKELRKQNEETEQILEYESKGGVYKHKGTYGTEKSLEAGETNWDYEEKKANSIDPQFKKEPKMMKKKYGARQNYVRSKKVSGKAYESFSEIINSYKEGGLKTIAELLVKEEPSQDEFEKEVEDQKAKMDGKKKGADVAKGSVQAVKQEETEIAVINADVANGVEMVNIDEREMTDAEMKERERIVKGMKKGMQGFKQRYGERAKSVMYATATKTAMKEEQEDHWQKGYDHVREPIADEPYLDNARERFKELKKENPHKKGTKEHERWHAGASTAYEEHRDMLKGY